MILVSHSDTHVEDHPLNPNPDSQWQSFFKDNEVLLQVNQDLSLDKSIFLETFSFSF